MYHGIRAAETRRVFANRLSNMLTETTVVRREFRIRQEGDGNSGGTDKILSNLARILVYRILVFPIGYGSGLFPIRVYSS